MTRTRTALTALAALTLTTALATPAWAADRRGDDRRDWGRDGSRSFQNDRHDNDRGRHDGNRDWDRGRDNRDYGHNDWVRPVVGLVSAFLAPPPPPVVVVAPRCGHWKTRSYSVLVEPAHYEMQVIPAQFQTYRDYYGRLVTVCVQPERQERIFVPDRYETRTQQVWVN